MSTELKLLLTRNGESVYSVPFRGRDVGEPPGVEVNEVQAYGFELEGREAEIDYGIWIGDIEAGRASRVDNLPASTVGVARSRFVLWDDAYYFEGARGIVWLRVRSRRSGKEGEWKERVAIPVVVSSSKLSMERYTTMLEQFASLAVGLVFDLVSKSMRATSLGVVDAGSMIRTSAVELRILEHIWPVVASSLQQIASNPALALRRSPAIRNCWGSERFDDRSVAMLARRGVDPRLPSTTVPFQTVVGQIHEGVDTHEHRVIRGFIDLLLQRAINCRENLVKHVEAIEADRRWRDRQDAAGGSLYALEDIPRLERLENRRSRVQELIAELSRAKQMDLIARVNPLIDLRPTPVFSSLEPYRRIHHELIRFLRTGLIIVDDGVDDRMKSTSRLYEQWVFLQLASAFRISGLKCSSQSGVLHTTRAFRFTLDLDRGARLTFVSPEGRAIVLRYEPWVMPRVQAEQQKDTVYRGREGDSAWSPDVLIEVIGDEMNDAPIAPVEYAVVVDAKYSRRVSDHHWANTAKYLEIRATATNRQVVKQQWIAFPSDGAESAGPIQLRDSSLAWTENGPSCPWEESIQGALAIEPPISFESGDVADGWIARPEPAARQFVAGLLRYVGIDCLQDSNRQ